MPGNRHSYRDLCNTLLLVAMAFAGTNVAIADQTEIDMLMNVFEDEEIDVVSLNVDVQDGIVTLSGDVDSSYDKERLLLVARTAEGISEVVDLITTAE